METDTVDGFENYTNSLCIPNTKEIIWIEKNGIYICKVVE